MAFSTQFHTYSLRFIDYQEMLPGPVARPVHHWKKGNERKRKKEAKSIKRVIAQG
jgi:hypothetical protein